VSDQATCIDALPDAVPEIAPVPTAIAAFLGRTARGPSEPTPVTSWRQFAATFGTGVAGGFVADAVEGYFCNGGTSAYIVRIGAEVDGDRPLTVDDYRGHADATTGLAALAAVADVTIVCAPDVWSDLGRGESGTTAHGVQRAVIEHCEQLADRIAILDAPPDLGARDAHDWRISTVAYDSKFAVLYYPWLKVFDDAAGEAKLVPPSGHIAGVWARTDAARGVHKAATNEVVQGVIGVGCAITRAEHELLDPVGVNCVRAFLGRGVRVWGSRTLSSDPQWQEISVRRVVSHIEASVRRGTHWLADAPDDAQTRRRLVRAVRTFLFQGLLTGALVGESVAEAFRVECADADGGHLVCEIGVAAKIPGEFTVFRLTRHAEEGSEITE
jgi:phage tail sheath protein FI